MIKIKTILAGVLIVVTHTNLSAQVSQTDKNYTIEKVYDDNGQLISFVQTYIDKLGRVQQVQSKDLENSNVIATHVVFDKHGRPALQTLAAPIYQTSTDYYRSNFIRDNNDEEYNYEDFDLTNETGATGEVDNPDFVSASTKGSLGWYYNNVNNEEYYTPSSAFPYHRTVFSQDITGKPVRIGAAGENLKIGSGHTKRIFYTTANQELEYVFGDATPSYKTVSIDEEGLERITYMDDQGKVLANCYSGVSSAQNCLPVYTTDKIVYDGKSYVDYHLPQSGTLWIERNFSHTNGVGYCVGAQQWNTYTIFNLTDLTTGYELEEGVDFTIDHSQAGEGLVTFMNDFANKSKFLRISVDHSAAYKKCINRQYGSPYPIQTVKVRFSYNNWSLYSYDSEGRLTDEIHPDGADCDNYDPNVYSYVDKIASGRTIAIVNNGVVTSGNHTYAFESSAINIDETKYKHSVEFDLTFWAHAAHSRTGTPAPCSYPEAPIDPIYNGPYPTPAPEIEEEEPEGVNFETNEGFYDKDLISVLEDEIVESYVHSTVFQPNPPQDIYVEETIENTDYNDVILNYIESSQQYNYEPSLHTLEQAEQIRDKYAGISRGNTYKFLPDPDCEDPLTHCFDKIENCDEVEVDQGGSCSNLPPGYYPCYRKPRRLKAMFKVTLESQGKINGLWQTVNLFHREQISGGTSTVTFTAKLTYNCQCNYSFDNVGLETVHVDLDHQFLSGYSHFRFLIKEILVAPVIETGSHLYPDQHLAVYSPIDWNDPIQDLAHDLQFNVVGEHNVRSIIQEPNHTVSVENTYNSDNQLTRINSSDEGETRYYYDEFDRLKLWRSAVQSQNDQYAYLDYDKAGRIIERGVLSSATLPTDVLNDPAAISNYTLTDKHLVEYDKKGSNFPTVPAALANYEHKYLKGRVSKTANDESATWYGYDQRGRLKWTVQYIDELSKAFTINYAYNEQGNIETLDFQKEIAAERLVHQYDYDANGRLINVKTGTDGVYANATQNAAYKYYQHGALKRMELGDELQGIDYVYTINGRLKSINNPVLGSRDPGKDGETGVHANFAQDIFGMTLDYFRGDYIRSGTGIQTYSEHYYNTNPFTQTFELVILPSQYNGVINSVRWRTRSEANSAVTRPAHEGKQLAFIPQYDDRFRLSESIFSTISSGSIGIQNTGQSASPNTWDGPSPSGSSDYEVSGISYDLNGNLKTLQRDGYSGAAVPMDDLTFHRSGNRLNQVADGVNNGNYPEDIDDQIVGNYSYDASGRMIGDAQGSNFLEYNSDNLPLTIYSDAAKTNLKRSFTYDERGQRLSKSFDGGTEKQYYIRDVNGNLMAVIHDNGSNTSTDLPVYGSSQLGFFSHDGDDYRYDLTDHLGNVRATIAGAKVNGDVNLLSMQDYYPFGSKMPGRSISSSIFYKLGYQSQPEDNETQMNAFELRLYDARIGGWLSPDPYKQHFSPYMAMSNNPLSFIDPDGGWSYFGGGAEDGSGDDPNADCANCEPDHGGYQFNVKAMFDQIVENGIDWWNEKYDDFYSSFFEDELNGKYYMTGEGRYSEDERFTVQYYAENPFYTETNLNWVQVDQLIGRDPAGDFIDGTPVIGAVMSSGKKLEKGNYSGAIADFGYSVVELFSFGISSAATIPARIAANNSSRILNFTIRQLQSKFKHAVDFGVKGTWNKAAAGKFSMAINQHINSSGISVIQGTYRGNSVIHYLNPKTGLNVISNPSGQFISGWKLNQNQLQNVIKHGGL